MYKYKVVKCQHPNDMEELINECAKEGWRVVDTVLWHNWKVEIYITFEKEVK